MNLHSITKESIIGFASPIEIMRKYRPNKIWGRGKLNLGDIFYTDGGRRYTAWAFLDLDTVCGINLIPDKYESTYCIVPITKVTQIIRGNRINATRFK